MLVRVQNFQSIKDATVEIKGFVVITGPNNSGKTAFMRAIRGLFTNAPAGPLLRKGECTLLVEVSFEDGNTVLWEKGWTKPNGKGGSVNRYVLNGKELSNVGRGVPPEVEALGMRAISAGTQTLWPQVADQFNGTLFLVNQTGSVAAEALSDVSKVGRLTEAMRLSERDRRSVVSELKVRRKDLKQTQADAQSYDGLDSVEQLGEMLSKQAKALSSRHLELQGVRDLRRRHDDVFSQVEALAGFDPSVVPASHTVLSLRQQARSLTNLKVLENRRESTASEAARYASFKVDVPDPSRIRRVQKALAICRDLSKQRASHQATLKNFEGVRFPKNLGTGQEIKREIQVLKDLRALSKRLDQAQQEVLHQEEILRVTQESAAQAKEEVDALLGERGNCPTCGSAHSRSQHV